MGNNQSHANLDQTPIRYAATYIDFRLCLSTSRDSLDMSVLIPSWTKSSATEAKVYSLQDLYEKSA